MLHIHLDPLGGLAGDMFLAALLDARPELADGAFAAMRAAGLPEGWSVRLESGADGALAGRRLVITPPSTAAGAPSGSWREIRQRLAGAALDRPVRERALDIFARLAAAEAAVHGIAIDEVHFHELADWDSIADVVGAAWLIEALAGPSWSSAPLPQGSGRVTTRHGPLPVPAPATARLLEGVALIDDGIPGERVTPTGAAIFRHLEPAERLPPGAWRVRGTGTGFGTRRLPGISNALRALVYEPARPARLDEQVGVIGFEVDDQSAEDLAVGLDVLRATDGVLDVVQLPALGKKGRLAAQIQVLARPERLDAAIEACFAETTTIGLRWRIEARAVLARAELPVVATDGEVRVKVVRRPDGVRTAKAATDDVAKGPGGQAARARRRRSAEACALDAIEREPDELEGG